MCGRARSCNPAGENPRALHNLLFVIASEAKQSDNQLIIEEIATAHMRHLVIASEAKQSR